MKIWVDDIRPMPSDFDYWFKTVYDTIDFIKKHKDEIILLDLDHDAGDYAKFGGDYYKILDWMEEEKISLPISIHSGNPYGIRRMMQIIDKNRWKYIEALDEEICDVIL